MTRVLLPNGAIVDAEGMRTVCQRIVRLEDGCRHVWSGSADISEANGIVFESSGARYFIGGMGNGWFQEIMLIALDGTLSLLGFGLDMLSDPGEVKDGVQYILKVEI